MTANIVITHPDNSKSFISCGDETNPNSYYCWKIDHHGLIVKRKEFGGDRIVFPWGSIKYYEIHIVEVV